jgi:small subunit ribosomal protein S3Ae
MAKARSRVAARKIKDRWRAKNWYNIVAPPSFDNITIADTLTDNPDNLINRVTEVSLQDLTNDFRKSHITIHFKINKISESNAQTQFVGHSLTSDYLRRMIRRRRSKIEGVYDVSTKDGAVVRIKPFATTDKRIQNSQRRVVREAMKKTIYDLAKTATLSEFIKYILDGKIGSDIYKNCRKLYPVKRIEIFKTEVISQPTIIIEEKKPKKKEEPKEPEEKEEKEEKPKKKEEKKAKPKAPAKKEEPKKPEKKEEKPKKKVEKKEKAKAPKKKVKPKAPAKKVTKKPVAKKETKKPAAKKTPAKKTTKKKPAKK